MQYVDTTLETVAALLPEDLKLAEILGSAASYIPAEVDFASTMQFLFFFAAISLIMGVLGRFVMGKRSSLNHAMSSTMGILFVYAVTVCIYTFQPFTLIQLLSPLPFVTFFEDFIVISPVIGTSLSIFCTQTLSLIILSFLVNLLDTFLPKGQGLLSWYMLRFFTVFLAMVLHFLFHWACNTFLPTGLVTYAPMLLLAILASMLFLGVLNAVLGVVLTIVNPIIGGIYTFFFSNIVGKQITKAVFSSVLIGALFVALDQLGYTVISIAPSAVLSYIPLGIVLLILWHLLGHVL